MCSLSERIGQRKCCRLSIWDLSSSNEVLGAIDKAKDLAIIKANLDKIEAFQKIANMEELMKKCIPENVGELEVWSRHSGVDERSRDYCLSVPRYTSDKG